MAGRYDRLAGQTQLELLPSPERARPEPPSAPAATTVAVSALSPAQQRLRQLGPDGWLRATGLRRQMHELMAVQYIGLEEGFLRRSIDKVGRGHSQAVVGGNGAGARGRERVRSRQADPGPVCVCVCVGGGGAAHVRVRLAARGG